VTEMMLQEDIASTPFEEPEEIVPDFKATVQEDFGNDSNMNTLSSSAMQAALRGEEPFKEVERRLETELIPIELPTYDQVAQPNRADLTSVVETRGTTEHAGGVEGAMDQIAFEIANACRRNKTLVVWLFDASNSQKDRREAIAQRFKNIYEQVGLQGVGEGDLLLTAAVSFGDKTTFLIDEPTSTIEPLADKIMQIPNDETGRENVFTALEDVSRKWGKYRMREKREVMYIIVTDERGDDFGKEGEKMERVIHEIAKAGVRVHCIGNAAIFGREKGYVNVTWTEGENTFTQDLPVDQGPETFYPENLELDFWGLSSRKRQLNNLSSSFGPYPLNRLCAETGGLYLVAGEGDRTVKYDFELMRPYLPDYRPIPDLNREIGSSKAKTALVTASQKFRIDRINMPLLTFDGSSDQILRNEILEAQKGEIVILDYRLDEVLRILQEGEKDRDQLTEPRWRAAFDLAIGRVLAMKVRAYGYNTMLGQMRINIKPFTKPNSNFWVLVPSTDMADAIPSVRKMAKQAEEYLRRVIDEHPGTPWATIAEAEFAQAMGWTWVEEYVPKDGNMAMGNGNNDLPQLLLAEDQRRREEMRNPRPRPQNPPKQ
ncbi:MAG TPA: vWA domain-containing protein, partial [Planctomycetaceae bacterium]|nr:vWA domain-containing protein [Planctomycetaceae bacterium]